MTTFTTTVKAVPPPAEEDLMIELPPEIVNEGWHAGDTLRYDVAEGSVVIVNMSKAMRQHLSELVQSDNLVSEVVELTQTSIDYAYALGLKDAIEGYLRNPDCEFVPPSKEDCISQMVNKALRAEIDRQKGD